MDKLEEMLDKLDINASDYWKMEVISTAIADEKDITKDQVEQIVDNILEDESLWDYITETVNEYIRREIK